MTYIPQKQIEHLGKLLKSGKVVVIYGAHGVGKTTLVNKFLETIPEEGEKILFVNGDDILVRQHLESRSIHKLRNFLGDSTLLIVDEAQYVEKIGLNLGLIIDHIPSIKIIVTGSSSFSLFKDVGELLTGRIHTLKLYPLSQMEISLVEKPYETEENLDSRLIYGCYPEVVTMSDNARREAYLREVVGSFLLKDILELNGIRHSQKLVRLLQLLAFQIGKEVSFNELGGKLGMSKNTVERYLDLLQEVFVIYRRCGFSRNLRKEVTKNHRFYFYDNGIRNALIGNFNPLEIRNDSDELWENYIVTERLKSNDYARRIARAYFWRTYDRKKIDIVEEENGHLFGYEITWQKARSRVPKDWKIAYPDAGFRVVHRQNYLDFIL
jgi:predicted AAA+ superfamily ATPase